MKHFIIALTVVSLSISSCKKDKEKTEQAAETKITPGDYLSSSDYKSMFIELAYDRGYPPSQQTIDNVKAFLNARLNKPGGIVVGLHEIDGSGKPALTLINIADIETKYRSRYSGQGELDVFIYLANADYAQNQGDSKVLGMQYQATSLVLFGKTLRDFSGGLTQPAYATLETTVTEHELGHAMGLVNNGTPLTAAHQDEPNGKHCSNKDCLMYYEAETTDIVSNLLSNNIPQLDQNCLNDLKNNGGK